MKRVSKNLEEEEEDRLTTYVAHLSQTNQFIFVFDHVHYLGTKYYIWTSGFWAVHDYFRDHFDCNIDDKIEKMIDTQSILPNKLIISVYLKTNRAKEMGDYDDFKRTIPQNIIPWYLMFIWVMKCITPNGENIALKFLK
jgi:hypothetical protein